MRVFQLLVLLGFLHGALAATTTTKKATTTTSTKHTTSSKHSSTTLKTTSSVKTTTSTKKPTSSTHVTSTSSIHQTLSTTTSKPTTTTTSTKPTTLSTSTKLPSTTTSPTTSTTIGPSTSSTATSSTSSATAAPTTNSGPRGLGFNDPVLTEPFSLSGQGSKVSWAYNWASDPYYPGTWTANSYNPALTFIPMLWSAADDLTSIWNANVQNAVATHRADSVLAFNEPDGCCWSCGNSCMNVSAAVTAYQQWVQPLAGTVTLGAPAVTNAEGDGVGLSYLQYFIGNCSGCTIDFIPIHFYGSVLDPGAFETYVQTAWQMFGKPIWITEFGTTSGTDAQVLSWLEAVLPWLDAQPYVKRYAYFMDTNQGSPYLLNTNDTMTDIGVYYNSG